MENQSIDNLATVNASYLTIENIQFQGANLMAVYSASTTNRQHITIQNCAFDFNDTAISGIRCSNYLIDNNSFNHSNNKAIQTGGSLLTTYNIDVTNNVIQNTGIYEGMQSSLVSSVTLGKGCNFEYNRVINSGYHGVSYYGDSVTIKNNYIVHFQISTYKR